MEERLLSKQRAASGERELYFSVVVATHNRLPTLLQVLEALEKQTDAPPFEVIILADGSTDETARLIPARRSPLAARFQFRSEPNSGPGKARNLGVSLASGRFVVI